MFRVNRDNIAAAFRLAIYLLIAVGFVSVVWQIAGSYAERRQNAEHRARQYSDTTDRRVASACATVERSAVLECVTAQVKASREDERTEYDLKAQQDSADAAFWMAVISCAALAATIAALWYVKETLGATRETVSETRRIGEAQVRCYLSGTTAQIGFTGAGKVMIDCNIANSGQSPARSVSYKAELVFSAGKFFRLLDEPVTDHPKFEVDISSGGEEEISSCLLGDYADVVIPKDSSLFIRLEIEIAATDVFNLPVIEAEHFTAHLEQNPKMNEWITLKRASRITA